jgi:hypothetical protein
MKAWHFLRENKKLGYDDGRLVRVGHTFKCDPDKLVLCRYGLHASTNIMDALQYAPGPIICRVELGGKILRGDDKCVASERTAIAMTDATNILHEMSCWSAERALKRIKSPDPRSVAAIQAKRKWLRGEITDKELDAARDAAWDAARDAARAAARAAAWDAAWAAAWDAAWDAARAAARAAARDAARAHAS